jgi:plastocyanin
MKRLSVLGTVALLALAGCGGGSDNSSSSTSTSSGSSSSGSSGSSSGGGGGGQQLALSAPASGALKFDKNKLTAKAGKVTITMTNQSSVPHDIAVKGGASGQGNVVTNGKSVVTLDLKPGKYTFYCSVDGHEAAGMNGELDVQ